MSLFNSLVGFIGAKIVPNKTAFHALRGYLKSMGVDAELIPAEVIEEVSSHAVKMATAVTEWKKNTNFAVELNNWLEITSAQIVDCLDMNNLDSESIEKLKQEVAYKSLVKYGVIKNPS